MCATCFELASESEAPRISARRRDASWKHAGKNAGTNSGLFAYAIGHDSWTAAAESAAKIQEITLGQPGPLMRLIRSGALVSSSVNALVES